MSGDALIGVGALAVLAVIGVLAWLARNVRRVTPGTALVVHGMGDRGARVHLDGAALVLPVVQRADVIDLSIQPIELDHRGKDGLSCKDGIRADVKTTFLLRVNPTIEDVLSVAQSVGCARATDRATLEQLFTAKFSEALKIVAGQLDFEHLHAERDKFRDQVMVTIGPSLNGYRLDDVAIDYLEQTPLEQLDPHNVLDARGIKKIKAQTGRN